MGVGASRGFAFVHFTTTADSSAFVETFGPSIRIGEDRCRVAFSREREDGDRRGRRRDDEGEEWRCRVVRFGLAPCPHTVGLTFDAAVSFGKLPSTPGMFPLFDPQIRFVALSSFPMASTHREAPEVTLTGTLTHPTPTYFTNDGQRDMAMSPPSQFLLFRNLESGVNEEILSRGVLKLATPAAPTGASESSLKRVLLVRDRRTNESWRFGFAEFSTPQEAQKAFKAYEMMDKFTISSKPVTVSYIHPGVFVPVYNAPDEAERFTFLPLTPVGGGMRLAYWDEEGYVSELVLSTAEENPSSGGEGANSKENAGGEKKGKKRKAESTPSSAAEKLAAKKAALPAHLQFWQNRHSELHGGRPKPTSKSDTGEGGENSPAGPTPASEDSTPPQESFADLNKLACLLCSRQFKTAEKLHQHERVSDLHATNLKNATLCETARKKLPKNSSSEYRDRAKERREAFGASTAPSTGGQKKKPKAKSPPAEEPEEPKQNKGAALLGKMGWTQGQGLGATGEGRTEHVVAEMYTAGVGLGMKGAKVGDVEEAVKGSAGGYQEFVRKTKERAKERYEEMG
jgi:RNA-binding protein 5/10